MNLMKYKHILLLFAFIALLSFITFYRYMTLLPHENSVSKPKQTIDLFTEEKTVSSETEVYLREIYTICEEYDLGCKNETIIKGSARAVLDNISEEELKLKYPIEAGWEVIWQGNKVILQQAHSGLCLLHRERWHLAPDDSDSKVVVYLGPSEIGTSGGIVQETNILLEELPFELQDRIRNRTMEFIKWDELIGTLDSLDE
ncbi:MAG: hypothetical protein CVU87_09010 [Firmicutes bacterium HGW-Firmicutes-12]|jgi:hypothetical protein|nr:MAG: hypothetical protein CVU87_09010 [Firmicutes bacterium HGW-Firmicutes-12]